MPRLSLTRPAAAVVGLLAAAAACTGPRDQSTGPVSFPSAHDVVAFAGVRANAEATVVFGATEVVNTGTSNATLEAGSLVGGVPTDAASVVEVRVRDSDAPGDGVGAGCWPFEHLDRRSVPLDGYVLPPGGEVELLFVVCVEHTGHWLWPVTTLRYTVDGRSYEASTTVGFEVLPTKVNYCERPPA